MSTTHLFNKRIVKAFSIPSLLIQECRVFFRPTEHFLALGWPKLCELESRKHNGYQSLPWQRLSDSYLPNSNNEMHGWQKVSLERFFFLQGAKREEKAKLLHSRSQIFLSCESGGFWMNDWLRITWGRCQEVNWSVQLAESCVPGVPPLTFCHIVRYSP